MRVVSLAVVVSLLVPAVIWADGMTAMDRDDNGRHFIRWTDITGLMQPDNLVYTTTEGDEVRGARNPGG